MTEQQRFKTLSFLLPIAAWFPPKVLGKVLRGLSIWNLVLHILEHVVGVGSPVVSAGAHDVENVSPGFLLVAVGQKSSAKQLDRLSAEAREAWIGRAQSWLAISVSKFCSSTVHLTNTVV